MKTKKLIIAIVAVVALTIAMPVETGATPPPWAPAHGYREKTRQIYFPQQNMYYDLNRGTYIYLSGRNWVASVGLPSIFRNVNLRVAPQVQLMLNTDRPYIYNRTHRAQYWDYKAQKDYYKRMDKEQRHYSKNVYKAQKKYYKESNKAAKKYHKKRNKW